MLEYIAVVALVALVAISAFRVFGAAVFGKTLYEATCIANLDSDCKGNGGSSNEVASNDSTESSTDPSGDIEALPPPPSGGSSSGGSQSGSSGTQGGTGSPSGAGTGAGSGAGTAAGAVAGATAGQAGAGPSSTGTPTAGQAPAASPASLALARQLVQAGGTATQADAEIVAQELAKLPENVLASIKKQGIKVVAAKGSVTDYYADLKGVRPRGWPPGSGWDNVPGLARGKTVVIAVRNGRVPPKGDGHGSHNLVIHETFHAIDMAGKKNSDDKAFVAAREKDLEGLSPYLQQQGKAGREEAFAESAAQYYGHDPLQSPNMGAYWRENEGRIFPGKK